jgi:DNA primase
LEGRRHRSVHQPDEPCTRTGATAFTDAQAERLRPFIRDGRSGVIVATDADRAGQRAAHRIFWQLTVHGEDPRHLAVPIGKDPAELLQSAGAAALRQALAASPSLATALIDARLGIYADRLDTIEGQVHGTRRAAEVIAALPITSWPAHLTHVVARTGIAPEIALSEVFDAAQAGTVDSRVRARIGGTDRPFQPVPDLGTDPYVPIAGLSAREPRPGTLTASLQAAQRARSGSSHPRPSAQPWPSRRL